ncbi:uncharacterized protein FIBRA_08312 [Fibroporia radiculosa]|uniref:Insecticide toxin TcdB middle/N-terminal domain-containing protein n=1 Tax=Fibroporia radiculosa TaxID=599839 RepID=J4GWK1_9APHY|nr:uncharacterized protein FIBRA_08312 [Fibroporia radiculosa]CCM06065.1 predicted protein [Fibroporia radiculosa]
MSNTIVGSLSIDQCVDPNGSLVLKVPIRVPPAKLSPTVEISYHSAVHQQSVVGHGWTLDAFGLVQRTAATIAQDGFAGFVNYDSNDRFTLNGQRLMKISSNEYRYEVEQWTKVIAVGSDSANPDSWIEYLPDGTVRVYGSTNDSNVKAQGQSVTRVWAISETYDSFSNFSSFTYANDTSTGSFYLSSINFGGNKNLQMPHQRTLSFDYEDRPDIETEYTGGYPVTLTKRLSSVSASINDSLVYKHSFVYDTAPVTGWSRLQSVALSDDSGTFVTPLAFDWCDSAPTVFDDLTALTPLTPDVSTSQVFPVDVAGRGRTDLILASSQYDFGAGSNMLCLDVHLADGLGGFNHAAENGSGSTNLLYPTHMLAVDANGDGKTDLLHIMNDSSSGDTEHVLTVLLSTENGYVAQQETTFVPDVPDGQYFSGDFEGNGNVGVIYLYNEYTGGSQAFSIVQFTCDGTSFHDQPPVVGPKDITVEGVQVVVADFNGDGSDDVFLISSLYSGGNIVCEISFFQSQNGRLKYRDDNPFAKIGESISWTETTSFLALPEQDGKTGLLVLSQSGNGYLQYQTLRSTGKTLAVSDQVTTNVLYDGKITLGRSTSTNSLDIVNVFEAIDGTEVSVLHFYNGSFIDIRGVKQPPGTTLQGYDVNFADTRGIGRADCLFTLYDDSKSELSLYTLPCAGTVSAPADFITGYKGGLGAQFSVTYAPLTDTSVYDAPPTTRGSAAPYVNALARIWTSTAFVTPSSASTLPIMGKGRSQLVHFPKYVVKEMRNWAAPSTQPDGYSQSTFFYTNGRMSFDGRGWLGFETIRQTVEPLGAETTNIYLQEFPFIGQMSRTTIRDASDPSRTLKDLTYDLKSFPANGGANCYTTMPVAHQTFYEGGSQAFMVDVTHDYDSYANIVKTVIAVTGKPALTLTQTYSNDESQWLIGTKLSELVTSDGITVKQSKFAYLAGTQTINHVDQWVAGTQWSSQDLSLDAVGNVTTMKGPGPAYKTLSYDDTYSFPTTVTSAVDSQRSLTTKATYDLSTGQVASVIDSSGFIKAQKYDVLGRPVEFSEGNASSSLVVIEKRQYTTLDSQPVCIRQTLCDFSSDSWTKETAYLDGLQRQWKTAVPSPSDPSITICNEIRYDGAGRKTRQYRSYRSDNTNPEYTETTFDSMSRKIKVVSPAAIGGADSVTSTYQYSYVNGQIISAETRSGGGEGSTTVLNAVEYFPNPDSSAKEFVKPLAVSSIDELDRQIQTSYDPMHRVVAVTDPSGVQVIQQWDALSRQLGRRITNPKGISPDVISQFSVQYDDATNTTTVRNELLQTSVVVEKDFMNRPTKKTAPDEVLAFVYDTASANALGRLAAVTSSKGTEEYYTYDARGCLATSALNIDGQSFATSYEYTPTRQLSRTINPDGSEVSKTLFANSETVNKVTLTDGTSSKSASVVFSEFDDPFFSPLVCDIGNGLKSRVTLADNGAPLKATLSKGNSTTPSYQQSWKLNGRGRVQEYDDDFTGTDIRAYSYDLAGQLVQAQASGGAQPAVFSYDTSGNIAAKDEKQHVNAGWQLTSILDSVTNSIYRTYEYSPDGNLTSEKDADGKAVRSMAYDTEGKMLDLNGTKFVYNFNGRMLKAMRADGSITYYPSESYEVNVSDGVTTQTSYLLFQHRRASISTTVQDGKPTGTPTVNYYHGDHLGNIVAVSDEDGDVVTTYKYDAFGQVTVTGPDISRYKYSGKEIFDGLYYFGARFYDPATGRFVTLDNITISLLDITASKFNQYTFSQNNPVNFIDINGNLSFWWHLVWHLAVDVALLAAGVLATVFLPEVPILAEMAFGAALSGFMYDGEALWNAAVNGKQELNDAAWGVALGVGAVSSVTGFLGSTAASKAGFAAIEAADLLGARVGGKFVGQEVLQLAKRGAVQLAVAGINGAVASATQQVLTNVVTGQKDVWDGVGMSTLTGAGGGIAGGAFKNFAKSSAKALTNRTESEFFYSLLDGKSTLPYNVSTEVQGIRMLSSRILDAVDVLPLQNFSRSSGGQPIPQPNLAPTNVLLAAPQSNFF